MTNSSPLVLRSSSVRRPFCSVLIRCISVLSVTSPLLVRWGPLRVRYLSGRSPVLVRYVSVQYSSRGPRAAAASTFTNGRPTDKGFWQIFHPLDVRSRYPVRCDWAKTFYFAALKIIFLSLSVHLLHRMNVQYNELIKRKNEHMRCYIEIDIDRYIFFW